MLENRTKVGVNENGPVGVARYSVPISNPCCDHSPPSLVVTEAGTGPEPDLREKTMVMFAIPAPLVRVLTLPEALNFGIVIPKS